MRGYGQYCPIARGAEVFAERWTPIIVRNLKVGCETFGEILAGAPGLPRSVLTQRLRMLERYGVVQRRAGRRVTYHLTRSGQELADVCYALGVWGSRWLETAPLLPDPPARTTRSDVDAYLALWYFSRLVDRTALPDRRVVVRFDLTDASRPNRYWVLLARDGTEVCVKHPGHPEDLVVTTDASWLVRWNTGATSLAAAMRDGGLRIEGPRDLVRAFGTWGGLSPFAGVARPR